MSIDPRDKFFPTAPTPADYDAAVKRAEDAEDHLRREVASSQALQAENSALRTAALGRDVLIADLLLQVDKLNSGITEARTKLDEALRNFIATLDVRDTTIAELKVQSKVLRETIKDMNERLDGYAAADEARIDND